MLLFIAILTFENYSNNFSASPNFQKMCCWESQLTLFSQRPVSKARYLLTHIFSWGLLKAFASHITVVGPEASQLWLKEESLPRCKKSVPTSTVHPLWDTLDVARLGPLLLSHPFPSKISGPFHLCMWLWGPPLWPCPPFALLIPTSLRLVFQEIVFLCYLGGLATNYFPPESQV